MGHSAATTDPPMRYIPLSYNNADSQTSALRLVLALNPHWEHAEGKIEFIRFTDGITNTLLKIIRRAPGMSDEDIDKEAVLMRAYGNQTEIIIDREKETRSHALLASKGLAPPLLARFRNGLLYRFIRGKPCTAADLSQPAIYRGTARRLGEWHARLPISDTTQSIPVPEVMRNGLNGAELGDSQSKEVAIEDDITPITPRREGPTLWTVTQKWIRALPVTTEKERERRKLLQKELERIVSEFDDGKGIGEDGLVFSHCDLLCANVIRHHHQPSSKPEIETVSFIDYEYATPAPAAFDLANHLAEFAGYDCDYSQCPTRSMRRAFLREYVNSYAHHAGLQGVNEEEMVERLYKDVDRFRGLPGFCWGVWALIQATISQIDFDYSRYAEERLGEYWAWRREHDGSRAAAGEDMPLRERRWAEA